MRKRRMGLGDIERILIILLAQISIIKEHAKREVKK